MQTVASPLSMHRVFIPSLVLSRNSLVQVFGNTTKSKSKYDTTSDTPTTVDSREQEKLAASAKVLREGNSALGNIAYISSALSHAVGLARGIEVIIAGMKNNPFQSLLLAEPFAICLSSLRMFL